MALLSYILQYSAEFISLNWIFFQEFFSKQICLQNLRIFLNYALLFIIKLDYPRLHVLIFFLFANIHLVYTYIIIIHFPVVCWVCLCFEVAVILVCPASVLPLAKGLGVHSGYTQWWAYGPGCASQVISPMFTLFFSSFIEILLTYNIHKFKVSNVMIWSCVYCKVITTVESESP